MKQSIEHSQSVGRASRSGNNRTPGKEQFYTPPATANRLVAKTQEFIPDLTSRLIIEPAAGTGSFVDAFKLHGIKEILALDVDPKRDEYIRIDFLKEFSFPEGTANAIALTIALTNPPFGRNHSLSVPFFNKLADYCSHIGFIIPKSWRKWSVQDRLDKRFHLLYDEELSIDYINEEGTVSSKSSGGLNTVFQLWEKREEIRKKKIAADHGLLKKVTPEEADVSFTVFGHGCATVKLDFPKKPNTTQLFFKLTDPRSLKALQEANFKQFYNNVAFVEALSWNEINYALNEYLGLPLWAG